jgi:hypothetical protein
MIFWLLAVIIVIVCVFLVWNAKKRKAVPPAGVTTHKKCSFCSEEIAIDATVCKYCGLVVVDQR